MTPLAPVVEGGQLTDDREDRVRQAEVVRWRVGQALDLAHDVVAEVADQPAVHRRQPVEGRRAVHGQQRLERAEHALVEGDAVGQAAAGHLQRPSRAIRVAAARRPTKDQRPH